jgi:Xaa-Pro aminopeptidase
MHQPVKRFETGSNTIAVHALFRTVMSLTILLSLAPFASKLVAQSQKEHWPAPGAFTYHYPAEAEAASKLDLDHLEPAQMRAIYTARRSRVLEALPEGAMLIFSEERNQARHLEFQVPQSENHDFQYLTGLEGLDSYDSALLLLPTPKGALSVLYTSANIEQMKSATGVDDVRTFSTLEQDLSIALTDYRDWRITQIRRWPLAEALSQAWGRDHKVLYVNYPRFPRLGMQEPVRLEFFSKLQRFSPEIQLRDSADIMDPIRMLHDAYDLACIRRAVQITGEGISEGLRMAKPGVTETQVMETMDYVYRYRGATLGFPTEVQERPLQAGRTIRQVPEGFIAFVSRSGDVPIYDGGIVHVDTGASFLDHSADLQRVAPTSGHFTPEQRRVYELALKVQKAVIEKIKPGVHWWELHNLAVQMLHDEGGYDQFYKYGIGHFIGMEVHDEGDYEQPLQAGMAMAIEQGIILPDGPHMAFEDDVIVTETGHDWVSRSVPIEADEVEKLVQQPSSFTTFVTKPVPPAK